MKHLFVLLKTNKNYDIQFFNFLNILKMKIYISIVLLYHITLQIYIIYFIYIILYI